MQRELFIKISADVENADPQNFQQRMDFTKLMGYSTWIKTTTALRMLAYGVVGDILKESIGLGGSTALKCVKDLFVAIVKIYKHEYMREPTREDLDSLLEVKETRGFPGMIGSVDCMHWEWKNCPTAWHRQYTGKSQKATVILEAVATQDLWIWHAYFGLPGSNNDINVLDCSPIPDRLMAEDMPTMLFRVNSNA